MNLLKSKLRRTTAVVAGAILGLGGVAFLASPASAHHSVVKGAPTCDTATGDWVVEWTVKAIGGDYKGKRSTAFRLNSAEASPSALAAPDDTHKLVVTTDGTFPFPEANSVKALQRVSSDNKSATLKVNTSFDNGYTVTGLDEATVTFEGECDKPNPTSPKPEANLAFSCDTATVTLSNGPDATKDAEFTVKGSNGFVKDVTVKVGDKSATVEIPAKDAESIKVYEKSTGEKPILTGKYEQPENCTPPAEVEPEAFYEATCESLIFTIDNTKGTKTVEAKFTPNKGEAQSLTVKPGEKADATFKGVKGLEVTATGGDEPVTIKWDDEKPKECDATSTPTATPTEAAPGEGGGLPVTGPVASSIAGGAALLLIAGGVLFFMARRRKVKFTA